MSWFNQSYFEEIQNASEYRAFIVVMPDSTFIEGKWMKKRWISFLP
jgi:hypothetical protein